MDFDYASLVRLKGFQGSEFKGKIRDKARVQIQGRDKARQGCVINFIKEDNTLACIINRFYL